MSPHIFDNLKLQSSPDESNWSFKLKKKHEEIVFSSADLNLGSSFCGRRRACGQTYPASFDPLPARSCQLRRITSLPFFYRHWLYIYSFLIFFSFISSFFKKAPNESPSPSPDSLSSLRLHFPRSPTPIFHFQTLVLDNVEEGGELNQALLPPSPSSPSYLPATMFKQREK